MNDGEINLLKRKAETMTDNSYRIWRKRYTVPVDSPDECCAEDLYDYIDGLHGEFPPDNSELILETSDKQRAVNILMKHGEQLEEMILNRDHMPQTVSITQIDLRAKLMDESDQEYHSIMDQLTPISIMEPEDPDWWMK